MSTLLERHPGIPLAILVAGIVAVIANIANSVDTVRSAAALRPGPGWTGPSARAVERYEDVESGVVCYWRPYNEGLSCLIPKRMPLTLPAAEKPLGGADSALLPHRR